MNNRESLVFRATHTQPGRNVSVTPQNSPMRHLYYGRIRLDSDTPSVSFDTGVQEVGFICLNGTATATVNDTDYTLVHGDGLYVPPGEVVSIAVINGGSADIVEFGAQVSGSYGGVRYVSYADEVVPNPSLHFKTGGDGSQRTLNIVIGKNVEAGRILAGFTHVEPGNWASWPPHEHGAMLEEMYLYFDMPAPAFGIQFSYPDANRPDEHAFAVHDGDVVLMPEGFHPNVAVPGHPMNFLWIMAAHREVEDRQFGVVNVQPGFGAGGSGLEASRK